jgi:AcrR family transcriptional regulator
MILKVALELFVTQGYEATTTRQITDRLGITPPALYYHFRSKLAVLEALVVPYVDEVEALLAGSPSGSTDSSSARRELLTGYAKIVIRSPEVADLLGRERVLETHPQLGPRIENMLSGLTARLAAPAGDGLSLLRATAAIGAIRRPVLRPEIDHEAHLYELVEAALAALGA